MEEDKPSIETDETVETPTAEEPTPETAPESEPEASGKSSKAIFAVIGLIALILIVAGLFLPPISLGERLGLTGGDESPETAETTDTGAAPEATEATDAPATAESSTSVPGEFDVMAEGTAVNVASVPATDLASANVGSFPENVATLGAIYTVAYDGTAPNGQVTVNIPAGSDARTADVYGWDGSVWQFVAGEYDPASAQITTRPQPLYAAYSLVQPGAPAEYTIGAEVETGHDLAPEILEQVNQVTVGTLLLVGNGDLQDELGSLPDGDYAKYIRVSNSGAVVDVASLSAFLSDPTAQTNQVNALVNTAVSDGYAGVNLDYQGVDLSQADEFTSFVGSLADTLHAQGLKLIITLNTPREDGASWNSGGQDWAALGQIADEVHIQMPLDPIAYNENETAVQLLDYAIRNIDRSKLMMLSSANAVSRIGESIVEMPNENALANFGTFSHAEGETNVAPNTPVDVAFTGEATPLEWDGPSHTYRFSYQGTADQTHYVWLGNPAALGQRLEVGEVYNVQGAAVRGLGTIINPAGYTEAVNALGPASPPETQGAAIVWTVRDESDSVLASESGSSLTFTWEGVDTPGAYTINADFALGDNVINLGTLPVTVEEEVAEEPAEEEEVAEEEAAEEETAETSDSSAAAQPATSYDPGDDDAVVTAPANVRTGPGITYGTLTGGVQSGSKLNVIGRNEDNSWLNVVLPDDREGWIFAQLVQLNDDLDVGALEVVEVAAPVASGDTSGGDSGGGDSGGGDSGGGGSAPPPPVSAPPVANAGFELGGQSHTFANPQLMSHAGMNWIKFQHKWGPGGNPSDLAGRINQAHAAGFKVLLSIPGANTYPDSINFAEYVQFLGGVAALGPDAIEVWNEMNIDFEWPAGQIDPNSYVTNMLAPAYNAIKGANPNVMVISGAPAPTGFDNNTNAWADSRYMSGMAAAGAANYLDCVGAHYNAGATSPSQNTGHPAGNDHYSWFLIPTLNVYAQLGKPVCFTELGYLSGEDYGGVPSRFGWAQNTTVQQHANWLAEAVSLSANSGRVRMVIIFNVDFTQWGDDPQAGYAIIRKGGGCPACETLRSVMGG
ncbi:MAG: SH3 domain-containing protein [Chloroflexi bacterium]|nr:SH3 domain-containing protein [Chloroflexota bacterium]